jgi:short subunit dehydrogenase-like uncharacterized protein
MEVRDYDIIVVGAAGYTGRLVAEQIAQCDHLLRDAAGQRRWAVSGREENRTRKALDGLTGGVPPVIAADLTQTSSLHELTGRTKVIINLAGPYTPTAPDLIAACVKTQTSYVDLSGELPLLRQMIDQFDDAAQNARIRIVQMAGWEALPSDLTTLLASRRAVANEGLAAQEGPGASEPVTDVLVISTFSRKPEGKLPMSEAVSAGTMSSVVQMLENENARLLGRSEVLMPVEQEARPAPLRLSPFAANGRILACFAPVAFLNAPIVHRTAALQASERNRVYRSARYREGDDMGSSKGSGTIRRFAIAWLRTSAQRLIIATAHAPAPLRRLVASGLRKIVPAAGTGPTGRFQTDWEWTVTAQVLTESGQIGKARLHGRGHPGYTATAAMIAEVGLRIALERAPERFGCLTPALAIGSFDLEPWFVDSLSLA